MPKSWTCCGSALFSNALPLAAFRSRMSQAGFRLLPGEHPIVPVMFGDTGEAVRRRTRQKRLTKREWPASEILAGHGNAPPVASECGQEQQPSGRVVWPVSASGVRHVAAVASAALSVPKVRESALTV
ncbi:2-amino-3-ketobutyrate coenzyme A ligase [Amycolatopsis sp. M39]|nr:2-amino-3-ketobutyrate coenzyme A ligase [Amycolatopsis sp. M39]